MRMNNFIQNKKVLFSSIAAVTVFLLFLLFVYAPKNIGVGKLKSEIRNIDQQVKSIQAMLGDMRRLGEVLSDMQNEVASFEKRIPRKKEISSILSECSSLAKTCSVEVVSVKAKESELLVDDGGNPAIFGEKALETIQVELTLKATYKALADYIKHIQDSLNIFATINGISVVKNKDMAPRLDIKLILNVYVSKG